MNTHLVIKPLPAEVVLQPGTEVDASEWQNLDRLVEQRYLKPLAEAAPRRGRPPKVKESADESPE